MVSSFSAHEINQQPALSNDFLIVCLITEWTQPDYDKQSMDQTGITQMSSLHLNPVISGEGKGREGYPAQERHSFILPRWVCVPRTGCLDIQARWRQNVLLFSYPYLTFILVLKIFCLMFLQSGMMLWTVKKCS